MNSVCHPVGTEHNTHTTISIGASLLWNCILKKKTDDCNKLGHLMNYLYGTVYFMLIFGTDGFGNIYCYKDVTHAKKLNNGTHITDDE